jgi:hypothetical protein
MERQSSAKQLRRDSVVDDADMGEDSGEIARMLSRSAE